MAAPIEDSIETGILHHDVPSKVVDDTLAEWRKTPIDSRFSPEQWKYFQTRYPNVSHFLRTTSYELAPTDPVERGRIAASMLGLLVLVNEARINEDTSERLQAMEERLLAEGGITEAGLPPLDGQVGPQAA